MTFQSKLMPMILLLLSACCLTSADAREVRWNNSLQPAGKVAATLQLARAGNTEYVIVIPATATTTEAKAAEDLAHWLNLMTDATFPIVSDSVAVRDCEINIGNTNRLNSVKFSKTKTNLGNEGYAIDISGKSLFLLGGKVRGPINAVYALLEEDLGCRWYARDTQTIPHKRLLRLNVVPRNFTPHLMIRDPFYWDAFQGEWSLRNRTNSPSAEIPEEFGGHIDYDGLFVHTFNTLLPPGEYFEKHPEYFMMTADGKRITQQFCMTNPDVLRICTENLLKILRNNPDTEIVEVSPNDGGMHCMCPDCKAVDDANGSPSGTLVAFVNSIAEAVEKERPEVTVSTLAYLDTVDAPKIVKPRHNVAIRLCNDLHSWRYPFTCFATDTQPESKRYRDAIIGWSKICKNIHIWDYFVNFSHYSGPMPNMDVLQPTVDFYLRYNVTGIMMQAAYQGPGAEFGSLRAWVMAKLLWDPSLDVDTLIEDFITGYYENSAPQVQAYWDMLNEAKWANMDTIAKPEGGIRFPMTMPFLSKDLLVKATAVLDDGINKADSEAMRRRVELVKFPVLYAQLRQGAEIWADDFAKIYNEFEQIARQENIQYLSEGAPDLDKFLNSLQDNIRVSNLLEQYDVNNTYVTPLGNEWQFAIDEQNQGESKNWMAANFDTSKWAKIRSDLGNGWESQGFTGYTGYGWYQQKITMPEVKAGETCYLYFGAVDEDAWVYLDGKLLRAHTCEATGLAPDQIWITPFLVEVPKGLKAGSEHTLTVKVYNRMGMGGIHKQVSFITTSKQLDPSLAKAYLEKINKK